MEQKYDSVLSIRLTRPSFKTEGRHTGFKPNTTLFKRWKAALPIMANRTAVILLLLIGLWATAASANNNEPPNPVDHIKNYVKHSDKPVTAYNIAEHIEGLMATTFGTATQFNTGVTGGFYAMSIKALSASTFVIAYADGGNSYNGTAIVGTVSGTSLIFGSESVFKTTNFSAIQNISVAPLSATSFVVTYENFSFPFGPSDGGATKIGTVTGSGAGATISFGAEVLFESVGAKDISVAALSSTTFVVAYGDNGNSDHGTAIVGTVSGTTITYGSEYVYNAAFTSSNSITALSSTAFVVAYTDGNIDTHGTAIVGTVSGTTITYGSEYVYNAAFTSSNSITALSSTAFVVAYTDGNIDAHGTAIVGTVSGNAITYGSEYVYNAVSTIQFSGVTTAMNSTQFVVVYTESTNEGKAIIGTVSGTGTGASIAYSTEETISASGLIIVTTALRSDLVGPPTTNATHYVTAYADFSNGIARVGDATADVLPPTPAALLDNRSNASNGAEKVGPYDFFGDGFTIRGYAAAPFTTGTAITSESITVDLEMDNASGSGGNSFTVQIWGELGGAPDPSNIIATLSGSTNPSPSGTYTYTGTATWPAGQNLFIVCTGPFVSGGSAVYWQWKYTGDATIVTADSYTAQYRTYIGFTFGGGYSEFADNQRFLFSLNVGGVALPVELITFEAAEKDQSVVLNWQTASEENNRGFEVERSVNGEDFITIGFVEGKGTSVELSDYRFTDNSPMRGINYYRLKQMDFDGQFEYSEIRSVPFNGVDQSVQIYPNPVQDELTIEEGIGMITIYNALGQPIRQIRNNERLVTVDTAELPKGIYTLHIQKAAGKVVTMQFVK